MSVNNFSITTFSSVKCLEFTERRLFDLVKSTNLFMTQVLAASACVFMLDQAIFFDKIRGKAKSLKSSTENKMRAILKRNPDQSSLSSSSHWK